MIESPHRPDLTSPTPDDLAKETARRMAELSALPDDGIGLSKEEFDRDAMRSGLI